MGNWEKWEKSSANQKNPDPTMTILAQYVCIIKICLCLTRRRMHLFKNRKINFFRHSAVTWIHKAMNFILKNVVVTAQTFEHWKPHPNVRNTKHTFPKLFISIHLSYIGFYYYFSLFYASNFHFSLWINEFWFVFFNTTNATQDFCSTIRRRCWNMTLGGIDEVIGQQKARLGAGVEMCTVSISVSHSQPG